MYNNTDMILEALSPQQKARVREMSKKQSVTYRDPDPSFEKDKKYVGHMLGKDTHRHRNTAGKLNAYVGPENDGGRGGNDHYKEKIPVYALQANSDKAKAAVKNMRKSVKESVMESIVLK